MVNVGVAIERCSGVRAVAEDGVENGVESESRSRERESEQRYGVNVIVTNNRVGVVGGVGNVGNVGNASEEVRSKVWDMTVFPP